ncbi:feruloyl-CoA synthase-like [Dermacentor variabilis]|uniref:feruloyl-CoA synthase-like n=1 Tax=Dermacentor variabilis TaxID=34621 RepID=UPI003F5AF45B
MDTSYACDTSIANGHEHHLNLSSDGEKMKAPIKECVVYSPYPSIDIPVCSIYDLLKEKLLWKPHKVALVDDSTSVTRAEVLSRMKRYAVGFRQNGVVPGDRICIHLKNSVENLLAMYGCVLAGAAVVLAKTSLNDSDLRYQADDSDSTHILTDLENAEKIKRAVASLSMKGLFCMGRTAGFVSAAEFAELDESEYQEVPVDDPKSTVLAVCYTSGSTGTPKGMEITHYNYVACCYTSRHGSLSPGNAGKLICGYVFKKAESTFVLDLAFLENQAATTALGNKCDPHHGL